MLSCSMWFSAPSFWMGGGLESRCVGRVCVVPMVPCEIISYVYFFRRPSVHKNSVSRKSEIIFNCDVNLCRQLITVLVILSCYVLSIK